MAMNQELPTFEECLADFLSAAHPGYDDPISAADERRGVAAVRSLMLRARPAPSSSPCPDCESKDAFIDALQKRIDSLLSGTVESFVDGVLTIRPHKEVVAVMAEALASVLDEAEAPNYVEMELKRAGSTKAYRLTIQRPEGRSAHELRMEAERKLAELKASPSPAPSHALVEAVSSVLEHDCPVCFDQDPASQAAMKRWINLGDEYRSARSSLPAAKKDGGA